jgi:hypothetical protein
VQNGIQDFLICVEVNRHLVISLNYSLSFVTAVKRNSFS